MTEINKKQLWENVLVDLELSISKANFSTWFKDTGIVKYEDGVVFIGVPNQFAKDWISEKHHKLILKTLRGFIESVRRVEYMIVKNDRPRDFSKETIDDGTSPRLPLEDHYVGKGDNLNPRYTFESFVVGPFNELAYAAAQAVIREPGIVYNPLFIHGETGYGKTHLIQSIGNQLKKSSFGRKIIYITAEKFAQDVYNAMQTNSFSSFKEKYRQYDVCIMDDIQFFSKKEKTQEEMFHLFNSLFENNRQIVLSSDKHPHKIPDLEARLQSRFSQGMVVDINEPDLESKISILQNKALKNNIILKPEVVEYIAQSIEGSIRDLEGALNAVICQTQVKGRELSITEIKNLVKESVRPKKVISPKEVVKKVAEFYHLTEDVIYEKTRRKEVVRPRQIIMYILREDFNISYPTIGAKLGGRDHTTVIHSCDKVKQDLTSSPSLLEEINHIRIMLK